VPQLTPPPSSASTPRCALYARVSRPDEATAESPILQNQVRALREYIASRGYAPAGEYIEIASGGTEDRPEFNRLLHDAALQRGRPFDLIAFSSLSRVTRGGVAAALDVLRRLESCRCFWAFVEQPSLNYDSTTPKLARDILLSVLAAVDEDYRARISRATRSAYARRKALAEANGVRIRWGRPRKIAVTRDASL
jgi:DNA invertase Pin-like site-specific DNA recombinase